MSHAKCSDFEHVYEPSEDTFLLVDAFDQILSDLKENGCPLTVVEIGYERAKKRQLWMVISLVFSPQVWEWLRLDFRCPAPAQISLHRNRHQPSRIVLGETNL